MNIQTFINRWQASGAAERANYQLFLAELCDVIGVAHPQPAVEAPHENAYVFEKRVPSAHGSRPKPTPAACPAMKLKTAVRTILAGFSSPVSVEQVAEGFNGRRTPSAWRKTAKSWKC